MFDDQPGFVRLASIATHRCTGSASAAARQWQSERYDGLTVLAGRGTYR